MADFQYSHVVCDCKNVTLGEIIHAIKEQGAKTLEDIEELTDAGGACGCCRSKEDDFGDPKMELYIDQILNKFAK
ncbi:MAG: (2Fe-2S)-binding protein [Campylobacterota bacterium]|nr:(2Fe-2S)-binding protein [Campylobacterota bacterium]